MQDEFGSAVTVQRNGEFWCVLVGKAATRAEAETLAAAVRRSDRAFQSAQVVQVDQ
jgi:hypothetical protein